MSSKQVNLAENNGSALAITAATFLALTYFSVILRVYVRVWLTKSFLADDWLMLVAQANFTVSCTFILIGVPIGIGRHNKALPQREEIQALKWQALATATYVSNMLFIKLSIAIFLLRLSSETKYRYALWISAAIVFVWSTVLFIWNMFFQCTPIAAQWDYTLGGVCVGSDQVVSAALALSAMTILSDFFYALLPVPIIWRVKMSIQAKITVMAILSLGIFASIATLVRLKFLADLNDTADILYAGTDAMVWTLIEPGVAITATSLATIRPLLRKLKLPGFASAGNTGRNGPTGGGYYVPGRSGKSATNRSATMRSAAGGGGGSSRIMPGFGVADVALEDLEAGGGGGAGGGAPESPTTHGVLVTKTTIITSISSTPQQQQQQQQPEEQMFRRAEGGGGGGGGGGRARENRSASDSESTKGLTTNPASSPVSENYLPPVPGMEDGWTPMQPPKDNSPRRFHLVRANPTAQHQQHQQQQQQQSWDGTVGSQPSQTPRIELDFRHGSWPSPVAEVLGGVGRGRGGVGGRSEASRKSSQLGVKRTRQLLF